ncbi:CarD family transcriptional regulator [Aurantimonas sp. VKM B-3413]|uniref:CarD family transcriptional regulator n=1 Tax=Aurantimonas sp. VKM B-3413 TaxID=2779401 RepID=UPI001E4647C6|nr:CarD family transcriptional regulator [Aurantimonas sp. VKM B-3413]MCB8840725.1 CarD family transcriptional regulator [Aurantimonas sp. VKM B-3413]
MSSQKKATNSLGFKTGESIVYPAHGVGQIVAIEEQEVAGMKLELFVIDFEKDKMRLKVPVAKANSIGMRKLSETDFVDRALKVVQGRARVKKTMWSRRAQEYDAKINSGDLIQIAEVVRDLYRAESQPEQSYSERQLYEAALGRMARELAAVNEVSETEAVQLIEVNLNKGPKRLPKGATAEDEGEGDAETEGDNDAAVEGSEQQREEAA